MPGIEALAALAQFGTVSEAATRLRLTQSAVTKRLQALQRAVRTRQRGSTLLPVRNTSTSRAH